jgi:hypothetical protein
VNHKNTAARQLAAAANDDLRPRQSDWVRAEHACRQLEVAGVEPQLQRKDKRVCVPGAALAIDVVTTLESSVAVSQLRDQAFAILASGLRISVSAIGLAASDDAADSLRRLCEVLAAAASDACARPNDIEIAVDADALAPLLTWKTRRETLGEGPVYLMADGERMDPADGWLKREQCEEFWMQLWHLRDASALRAACSSIVSSQCPLLSAEVATTVLPSSGVQVPVGTAWVPIHVDLPRFADACGNINEAALEYALHCSVDSGDVLHDLMEWPTALMRHDAWLNRRLAIVVTGLGELAFRRRLDPQKFHSLKDLDQLLQWVQQTLHSRSQKIARQSSNVPALDRNDPARSLPGGDVCDDWQKRWRRAVDQGAVRHRNLLVLSPWSVFPGNSPPDIRYADLLPLVAHGDACTFARSTTLAHWNINEFKSFHQRAWAALHQRDHAALIAERV